MIEPWWRTWRTSASCSRRMVFPPSTTIQVVPRPTDATWASVRISEGVRLDRPREFAIGAKLGFEKEADRPREAIDELAVDGEMVRLAL